MRLFSYLSRGQVRPARLMEGLGIDLYLAAQYYFKNQKKTKIPLDRIPTSLTDLFIKETEERQFVRESTDWILKTFQEPGKKPWNNDIVFNLNEVHFAAPIPRPGKVICIAGNFPAPDKLDKPEFPTVFLKPSSGVIGHQQPVLIPWVSENVVYEVELAVVIGKCGRNLLEHEATPVIAGYTIANDLGDRLLEKRTSQWTTGKMFDTFTPMGPIVITSDEPIGDGKLNMYTKVNNKVVQLGNTSQMFFNIPYLISYLSFLTTLEPGDVILTGSPKLMDGVPNPIVSLKQGDTVEVGIENFNSLINPIFSESKLI
jgi:acylpyruvate hydrolase